MPVGKHMGKAEAHSLTEPEGVQRDENISDD
jgi:hypothetical protein